MLTRRSALSLVAALLTRGQAQPTPPSSPCRLPERLLLDLGSGSCRVHTIRVQSGAIWSDISVDELLSALGARTGND